MIDPVDGFCKPLLLSTVEGILAAGIETVIIVVQQGDLAQASDTPPYGTPWHPIAPRHWHKRAWCAGTRVPRHVTAALH